MTGTNGSLKISAITVLQSHRQRHRAVVAVMPVVDAAGLGLRV